MSFRLSTEGLARASGRHPWITFMIWLLIIVASIMAAGRYMSSALTMEDRPTKDLEYYKGQQLIKKRLPGARDIKETVIIDSKLSIDDPAYQQFITKLQNKLNKFDKKVIKSNISYLQTGAPAMLSKDKQTTLINIAMGGNLDQAQKDISKVQAAIESIDKFDNRFNVEMIGDASVQKDFKEVADHDLATGEKYGIMIAVVILALVFGTITSAIIPIVLAVVAIIGAVGATAIVGRSLDLSFFILNMITMMGLAVGIDYSLFIVSRFREELRSGIGKHEAIVKAGASAGRAVFFSGLTVLVSLIGMFLIPHTIFKSLAIGAVLVVIFAILASLTLLPAVLSVLGEKVNSLRLPFMKNLSENNEAEGGFWKRMAMSVMNHPVVSLMVTLTVLLALASSYLNIDIGSSQGPGSLPDSRSSKKAYKIMEDKFSIGSMDTLHVVIDGDIKSAEVKKDIERFKKKIASKPEFGPVEIAVTKKADMALLSMPVKADPGSPKAQKAVRYVRGYLPKVFNGSAETMVTGETAGLIDFKQMIEEYTPIVFSVVLGLSFILLTMVFRSLIVPIKAILMNLLSVGAAYGLLVLVFQKGVGASFLGLEQVDVIEMWLPLVLFSILFGLSMDYHVFLLSRIKEHFDETGNNSESVAFGLASTGRIITGAAVIMVIVFSGFAAGDLLMFQQMGFGLAAAVLLDATIVRSILVPASMKLLGDRNWYLPKMLRWLPQLNVEGPKEEKTPIYSSVA